MKKITTLSLIITIIFVASCNSVYHSSSAVQYENYKIQKPAQNNSAVLTLLKPYSDSINKSMNDVLGENDKLLEKKMESCTLGYFMTDAFLYMANQKFATNVDAAFVNHGGIRLNELTPGKITRGKLYELMPFDNLLIVQKINGAILKKYLDTLALDGVINQSGLTIRVFKKMVKEVLVGEMPLDESKEYKIALSDYMISNSALLRNISMQNIGYTQRDAMIEYVNILTKQGKKVSVEKVNRVLYAE